ncbi:uncharacterized protein [Amphiura filiformis]|uniref:uncharacterized protein n=1 Tax=Amphiura filiformis TaxID=82378 RepID=UPI003B21B8F3
MGCCERPLVTSCWCCGLRGGTVAAAIYALIYSAFSIAFQSWTISNKDELTEGDQEILQQNDVFFATTCLDIALYVFLFVGSILVLVGTTNLNRYMFIAFLVIMGLLVIFQGVGCVLYLIIMLQHPNAYVMVLMLIAVLFTFVDLMCEICVFSFYQELRQETSSHMRAMYQTRVPSSGPISEKNTEVSFTSFGGQDGAGPGQGGQPLIAFIGQDSSPTKQANADDAPPPYVE